MRHIAFTCAACVVVLCGCPGGVPQSARDTLAVTARALNQVDMCVAPELTRAADEAVAQSSSFDEYKTRMAPWYAVEARLREAKSALLALENALDAWEAGSREHWANAAACAADTLQDLQVGLAKAGIEYPNTLEYSLELVQQWTGGVCRP